jgi:hypothetical protein
VHLAEKGTVCSFSSFFFFVRKNFMFLLLNKTVRSCWYGKMQTTGHWVIGDVQQLQPIRFLNIFLGFFEKNIFFW